MTSVIFDDEEFESVLLDDDNCDLCHLDTGENVEGCKLCLDPLIPPISKGYNAVPQVIHRDLIGHKECFKKAHLIHDRSGRSLLQPFGFGNSLTPPPRSSSSSPSHSPLLNRKSLSESVDGFQNGDITVKISKGISDVMNSGRIRSILQEANSNLQRPRSAESHKRSKTEERQNLLKSSSPCHSKHSIMSRVNFSSSMSNINSTKNEVTVSREIYSTTYQNASTNSSSVTCSKCEYPDNCSHIESHRENKNLISFDDNSWSRVKPVKDSKLVISVDKGDISVKDVKLYSTRTCDKTNGNVSDEENGDKTNGNVSDEENGNTAQVEADEDSSIDLLWTKEKLYQLSMQELNNYKMRVYKEIHGASSKLVDLVQERFQLKEEIQVRHVVIEQILKLERDGIN